MPKERRSNVFRLTGLKRLESDEELGKRLKEALKLKLTNEEGSIKIKVSIVPSCWGFDEHKREALVRFDNGFPQFLSKLRDDPQADDQFPILGKQVSFDCHFHSCTQLYIPEKEPVIGDIIAITGLNGHAYGSWRGQGRSHQMWLQHFFEKDFPQYRTITYGYDSKISGRGNQSLDDYAMGFLTSINEIRNTEELQQRPIIFIAHSLGGIILTFALLKAAKDVDESKFLPIYKATYAIFYFGVPHGGMSTDGILKMIDGDENCPQRQLLDEIKTGSPSLTQKVNDFREIIGDRVIVSFYEDQQTLGVEKSPDSAQWARTGKPTTQVSRASAVLNIPNESKIPAKGDHSTIVKFPDSNHDTYRKVKSKILEFGNDAGECVAKRFLPQTGVGIQPIKHTQNGVHEDVSQNLSMPDESENVKAKLRHIVPSEADGLKISQMSDEGSNLKRMKFEVANYPSNGMPNRDAQESPKPFVAMNEQARIRQIIGLSPDILSARDESGLPILLSRCFHAVEKFGLYTERIYQRPGNVSHINQIKSAFETDTPVDEKLYHDVYSVASLVKQFLKALPDALFTSQSYSAFVNAARIRNDIQRRDQLRYLIENSLPPTNYKVARALFLHLHKVQECSVRNQMTILRLSICFGPTLMHGYDRNGKVNSDGHLQVKVVRIVLKNALQIFG